MLALISGDLGMMKLLRLDKEGGIDGMLCFTRGSRAAKGVRCHQWTVPALNTNKTGILRFREIIAKDLYFDLWGKYGGGLPLEETIDQ